MAGSTAKLNAFGLNSTRLNNGTDTPFHFNTEARRLQDSKPIIKIEFIEVTGTVTDITDYYLSGANFEQVKERAPDEIQAGNFDIILANHDDNFSEYVAGSFLEDKQYHGARIRVSLGFILPDGTTSYETQAVGYIDQLVMGNQESIVTFRCRDIMWRIMDQILHSHPADEVPVVTSTNTGNGTINVIKTRPFKTVNENWTLTCTLGGGDSTATFSVVGSVSGNVGTATSGTEFSTGTGAGGIKFTIKAGGVNWVIDDTITFSTNQYPEWTTLNMGKIIWSILTGYNWDSDTEEAWSDFVLDFDRTQSDANVTIDYNSFDTFIDLIDAINTLDLTGMIPYETDAIEFIQNLLVHVLGSLYSGKDGRIKIKAYVPSFGIPSKEFGDHRKISLLGYIRSVDEIINAVSVKFKETDSWNFSDGDIEFDGLYVKKDSTSIGKYKEIGLEFESHWYSTGGSHAEDFSNKLVARYSEPVLNIDLTTGLDAITTEIGDLVRITDTKYNFSEEIGEVTTVRINLDSQPKGVDLRIRRDASIDILFGFIGSEADEGDGLSPQSDDYDTASDMDKLFAYFGSAATETPDYRMF